MFGFIVQFWELLLLTYVVGWFFSAMVFTRWFISRGCYAGCTRTLNEWGEMTGQHTKKCRTQRLEPQNPAEAMVIAVAWPMVWLYQTMCWQHARDPWTGARKRAIRGLSEDDLKRLDAVLYSEEKTS